MKPHWNLHEYISTLLSGIMAFSMFAGLPFADSAGDSDSVFQTRKSLNLEAEPLTASAASNLRRPINNESPAWIGFLVRYGGKVPILNPLETLYLYNEAAEFSAASLCFYALV